MKRRLWSEIKVARRAFALTVAMQGVSTLFMLVHMWAFSQVINRAFLLAAPVDQLSAWFLLALFGVAGRALTTWLGTVAAARLATRVKAEFRHRTMSHLLALGPAFMQSERSGELVTTLAGGVEKLDIYFREYLPAVLSAAFIPLIILIVALWLDVLTALVMFLTAPLIILFMALIGRTAGGLARRQYDRMSYLGAHFFDVMQGLTTLRLLNRSKHQIGVIQQITDSYRGATMGVLRVAFLSSLSLELLATLSVAVIAVEIGMRLLNGGISFERALFLLVIAPEFYAPLRTLGMRFHSGTEGAAAADRLYQVLDTQPLSVSGSSVDIPVWRQLRVVHASFAYAPERTALNGLTFTLSAGQHVAVIGESGSGKTTLAALLLRFISPQQGDLFLDDRPLAAFDLAAWHSQIAWVSQKPHLFNTTVEANIRVGNQSATFEQIVAAAKAANAHDFILSLPQGYQTPCGERGLQLSGGQAQRIAIARAFLKDAPLLILDEPTANLDAVNEAHVISALRRLSQGRTVLNIAHRLETLIDADVVFRMADGCIVEQGSYADFAEGAGVAAPLGENYA